MIRHMRHLVGKWRMDLIDSWWQSPCDGRLSGRWNGGRRLQKLVKRLGGSRARDGLLSSVRHAARRLQKLVKRLGGSRAKDILLSCAGYAARRRQ